MEPSVSQVNWLGWPGAPVALGCSGLHVRAQPPLPPCVAALSQGPRRSRQGCRAKHPTPGTAGLQAGPGGALTEHSVDAGAEGGHGRRSPHLCKRADVVFQSQAAGRLVQGVREGRLPPSPLHASLGAMEHPGWVHQARCSLRARPRRSRQAGGSAAQPQAEGTVRAGGSCGR